MTSIARNVWRQLQHWLGPLVGRVAAQLVKVRSSRVFSSLGVLVLAAGLLGTFLVPWDGGGEKTPSGWDTALGTAAQVIGGATAVVFALLVVPVQNAAARYSPIFLRYIRSDAGLWAVFAWTVVSLTYALAALGFGATLA